MTELPKFQHPEYFSSPADAIQWVKRSVYHITLIGAVGNDLKAISSGTGFLMKTGKMITCAHVIGDAQVGDDGLTREVFVLIYKDEDGYCHYRYLRPRIDETLHVYPELDLAILTLSNEFYGDGDKYFLHPGQHTKPSIKPRGLGHDAAILGYPLQELRMDSEDFIDFSHICLRADRGVVNQRVGSVTVKRYEFTIPFNPGNSGGPVFDTVTGDVFAMVQGYKSHPIPSLNPLASTRYSVAISLRSFEGPLKDHGII